MEDKPTQQTLTFTEKELEMAENTKRSVYTFVTTQTDRYVEIGHYRICKPYIRTGSDVLLFSTIRYTGPDIVKHVEFAIHDLRDFQAAINVAKSFDEKFGAEREKWLKEHNTRVEIDDSPLCRRISTIQEENKPEKRSSKRVRFV
jgi:predicted hydrocarbon binding protein